MERSGCASTTSSGAQIPFYVGRCRKRTLAGYFIVDAENEAEFMRYRWSLSKRGYPVRYENRRAIFAHHVVCPMQIDWDVDHRFGNKLDARRENLRLCRHHQNSSNTKLRTTNSSGYKGVTLSQKSLNPNRAIRWMGKITHKGINYTRYFDTPEQAANWYDKMAIELFGEFARLNFPG